MTARVGTLSVDGTPISQADLARIEAEETLHAEQRRRAVTVVAAASESTDEARMLLAMLGLDGSVVADARGELAAAHRPVASAKGARKRRAA